MYQVPSELKIKYCQVKGRNKVYQFHLKTISVIFNSITKSFYYIVTIILIEKFKEKKSYLSFKYPNQLTVLNFSSSLPVFMDTHTHKHSSTQLQNLHNYGLKLLYRTCDLHHDRVPRKQAYPSAINNNKTG